MLHETYVCCIIVYRQIIDKNKKAHVQHTSKLEVFPAILRDCSGFPDMHSKGKIFSLSKVSIAANFCLLVALIKTLTH